MKRRILSLLLVLALLLGLCATAMAAPTPTVSISSAEAKPGETVTLTVSIENNPGLAACMLYIYYDTSVFSVDPNEDVVAVGRFQAGGLIGNSIADVKASGRYNGAYDKDGVVALWYNAAGTDVSNSGGLLQITLNVNSNAANGDYTVEIDYGADGATNEKEENVSLNFMPGIITISGGTSQGDQGTGSDNTGSTGDTGSTQIETPLFKDVSGKADFGRRLKLYESGSPFGSYTVELPFDLQIHREGYVWHFNETDGSIVWHQLEESEQETADVKQTVTKQENKDILVIEGMLFNTSGSEIDTECLLVAIYNSDNKMISIGMKEVEILYNGSAVTYRFSLEGTEGCSAKVFVLGQGFIPVTLNK